MELLICHLYPDLLNLYGDRGNLIALVNRARWRNIEVRVTELRLGDLLQADSFDLYFIGGGEDRQQRLAARDLVERKGEALREAAQRDAVILAVCGGYQLLGHYYRPSEGGDLIGLGLLDLVTEHPGSGFPRLIGNIVIRSEMLALVKDQGARSDATLVGFENHGGRTRLGPRAQPLGRVLTGFGNNGSDGTEGAVYRNVYGTYLHGPLLPKNPGLTDHLIRTALRRKYGDVMLQPFNDATEMAAHAAAVARARR